uniref:Leucine-binding protein domain-containing protein n=1 Tax=Thermus caliditerrae TaxID=1330700 RepID=A0A7C5RE75_9DEIN
MELAGPAAEGVYITTTLDRDSRSAEVQGFLRKYQDRTGIPADMVGASGYAALKVMAQAVQRAGSFDGQAIRRGLLGLINIETAVGKVYFFTTEGDPVKSATVQVVKNGQFRRFLNVTDLALLKP